MHNIQWLQNVDSETNWKVITECGFRNKLKGYFNIQWLQNVDSETSWKVILMYNDYRMWIQKQAERLF
jgi:hypothetical protein